MRFREGLQSLSGPPMRLCGERGPGLWFLVEMEFDLDKALEEVPIHVEDPPFPSSRPEKRSSGFISELPSEEGRKLEHFTKLRPRRHKKQQPTQAAVGGGAGGGRRALREGAAEEDKPCACDIRAE